MTLCPTKFSAKEIEDIRTHTMTQPEDREAFVARLRSLWMRMNEAMSQGGDHRIHVDPEMVDDIRACEALVRIGFGEKQEDGR